MHYSHYIHVASRGILDNTIASLLLSHSSLNNLCDPCIYERSSDSLWSWQSKMLFVLTFRCLIPWICRGEHTTSERLWVLNHTQRSQISSPLRFSHEAVSSIHPTYLHAENLRVTFDLEKCVFRWPELNCKGELSVSLLFSLYTYCVFKLNFSVRSISSEFFVSGCCFILGLLKCAMCHVFQCPYGLLSLGIVPHRNDDPAHILRI